MIRAIGMPAAVESEGGGQGQKVTVEMGRGKEVTLGGPALLRALKENLSRSSGAESDPLVLIH